MEIEHADIASKNVKIIIADDDNIYRMILHYMLKSHYLNFEFADNGEEVITAIDNDLTTKTILIIDLRMPNMDGFDVLNHFKSNPLKYANVCTICISSSDAQSFYDIVEDGVYAYYLEKPVDRVELLAKIDYCINHN